MTGVAGARGNVAGEVNGGCSCDVGGAESGRLPPASGWALLVGLGALAGRRKRAR